MNVLVLNCGSSSLKWQIIETSMEIMAKGQDRRLASGVIERIGSQALVTIKLEGGRTIKDAKPLRTHKAAIQYLMDWATNQKDLLDGIDSLADIHAVGHRIVHGGEKFKSSVLIDEAVIAGIEDCIELAPLHNPANLHGISAATDILGSNIPQVAVFDTSFHEAIDETQYLYGIPYHFYRRYKIRRYGFHGTSHRYVAYRFRKLKSIPKDQVKVITIHLGNGCSACAIDKGKSVATSMGMTPNEGLIMGTRSGDIDPSIIEFLSLKEGITSGDVLHILNKNSGLLGISGLTNDMRELIEEQEENQDRRASLAIDIFCNRVKQYIGRYLAELGGADAIIFTGGIGSFAPTIREKILGKMDWLGLELDPKKNASAEGETAIHKEGSKVELWVIPTDEELLIARDSVRAIETNVFADSK